MRSKFLKILLLISLAVISIDMISTTEALCFRSGFIEENPLGYRNGFLGLLSIWIILAVCSFKILPIVMKITSWTYYVWILIILIFILNESRAVVSNILNLLI